MDFVMSVSLIMIENAILAIFILVFFFLGGGMGINLLKYIDNKSVNFYINMMPLNGNFVAFKMYCVCKTIQPF